MAPGTRLFTTQSKNLVRIPLSLVVCGDAIYGTTANPLDKAPAWGRVTAKPPDKIDSVIVLYIPGS